MELAPARGTHDLLPPDGGVMRALYDRAAALARSRGFRYVETPGFEATEEMCISPGIGRLLRPLSSLPGMATASETRSSSSKIPTPKHPGRCSTLLVRS